MNEGMLLNNRYQLLERLGSGGMSDVFRARDLMLERSVAIKVLHENYSNDNAFQQRFRQEARAAANLSHPNIVTVHDFGFDHGQLFIVMEHIPGKDLKTILRQRGRFSVEEAIPLMVQACAGIGYAHRAGLVHCDVKPHNMIVTPDAPPQGHRLWDRPRPLHHHCRMNARMWSGVRRNTSRPNRPPAKRLHLPRMFTRWALSFMKC